MYKNIKPFGYHVYAKSIGEVWIDIIDLILSKGKKTFDEKRERLCLQNVRIKILDYILPDKIIDEYGDKEKIDGIIYLTFQGEEMYDFDVVPSFSPGARSYFARLKEGRMVEYVVKRLSNIPESKKGIISFIHWDDYGAVLDTPYDDYLPCVTTIQFRMMENKDWYDMTVVFNARSMDAYQKANGNFIAIAMLANKIVRELNKVLTKQVICKTIDGLITDVHIYGECIEEARRVVRNYNKKYGKNN